MVKKLDIEELERKLEEARVELASKIGKDMVTKKGFKSYSAYTQYMKNTKNKKISNELVQQSQQFQEQLEKWTEDNYANRIDYKTFYPELLEFFKKLNKENSEIS